MEIDTTPNEEKMSDEEIAAIVLKKKEAFGILIKRYESKLGRYVKRLGASKKEDMEDILQNSFIKAYRNINDFDTKLSFSSWMYRIAHNEAVSFFRARSIRPEANLVDGGDEILSFIKDDTNAWEVANERSNAIHIKKAVDELDDKYKDIIVLRYFEGLEYEEIGDILKISSGSVATLIHRAKKKLAENLEHIKKS